MASKSKAFAQIKGSGGMKEGERTRSHQNELMMLKEIIEEHVHLKRRVLDKIRSHIKAADNNIFDETQKKSQSKKT